MLVFFTEFSDVIAHSKAASALVAIPFKINFGKLPPFPVHRDLVLFTDDRCEVISMFFANTLYFKIVYDDAEHDGSPHVAPDPGGYGYIVVARFFKTDAKLVVGEPA